MLTTKVFLFSLSLKNLHTFQVACGEMSGGAIDLKNAKPLPPPLLKFTKNHTVVAERKVIGHLEMTDDAPGETQMLDKVDVSKSIY